MNGTQVFQAQQVHFEERQQFYLGHDNLRGKALLPSLTFFHRGREEVFNLARGDNESAVVGGDSVCLIRTVVQNRQVVHGVVFGLHRNTLDAYPDKPVFIE